MNPLAISQWSGNEATGHTFRQQFIRSKSNDKFDRVLRFCHLQQWDLSDGTMYKQHFFDLGEFVKFIWPENWCLGPHLFVFWTPVCIIKLAIYIPTLVLTSRAFKKKPQKDRFWFQTKYEFEVVMNCSSCDVDKCTKAIVDMLSKEKGNEKNWGSAWLTH